MTTTKLLSNSHGSRTKQCCILFLSDLVSPIYCGCVTAFHCTDTNKTVPSCMLRSTAVTITGAENTAAQKQGNQSQATEDTTVLLLAPHPASTSMAHIVGMLIEKGDQLVSSPTPDTTETTSHSEENSEKFEFSQRTTLS